MTKLSEQQKSIIKSMCKQMLDLKQQEKKEIDTTILKKVVAQMLAITGIEGSSDEINDMVRDLEYEVSVRHTKGCAIFNDYEAKHSWYRDLYLKEQPFWERYRRFLQEKSSLDVRSHYCPVKVD